MNPQSPLTGKSSGIIPITIRLPKSGSKCQHTNLSRSCLNSLILPTAANNYKPPVRSIVLKSNRFSRRGIRLIVLESLRAHLDSLANEVDA